MQEIQCLALKILWRRTSRPPLLDLCPSGMDPLSPMFSTLNVATQLYSEQQNNSENYIN